MRLAKILELFLFCSGFAVGVAVYFMSFSVSRQVRVEQLLKRPEQANHDDNHTTTGPKYNTTMADQLNKQIRILCWVFTHPDNHQKKVPHVKATWGHKCTKLLFMSIEADPTNPDIIAIPVENGRSHLWNKTKLVMRYVYEHHRDDADWFMRADDDK
jgi:hypothetical protein